MAAMVAQGQVEGLSAAEVARRQEEFGPNSPPQPRPRSLARRVADQLKDPMILLLLGALVIVVVVGDVPDAIIIAAVIVLNTTIGVVQEIRAANAIAALNRMSAPHATVVRDGQLVRVAAAEVVPGDIVRLDAGDVIPADALLTEAFSMQVDESAMTGESVPVSRDTGAEVLSGTVVTRGRAFAEVLRTGSESGLGRIAALIASTTLRPTPLQQRLAGLSRTLVAVTLGLAGLVFVLGLLRGEGVTTMLILAVSLAVAAIPESLPAVVSVALAMGAYRMARRSALVRWLPAVETLGSVTVLASDKTGTLTEGRMVVQRLWTPDGLSAVTGHGYGTAGEVTGPAAYGEGVRLLLRDVSICNDARLGGPEADEWTIVGDPMEAALLVAAAKLRPAEGPAHARWERAAEVPFDSERQRMTTLHRAAGAAAGVASWLVVCKGAPEVVLDLVAPSPEVDEARRVAHELASQGFRLIAVADAGHDVEPVDGDLEQRLELRGLTAIADPPREGAAEVVADLRDAGIRTVLITGDHPATARAIADELGITRDTPEVADGQMVAAGEHASRVERIGVYARTKPEQKVDIVTAWQDDGQVVAMTGDGVNDAPALRRADIGVAMGDRGTEVARQAADLVLANDDLGTVVIAVGEGRRIFTNIRSFLRYGLSGGFAEVAVMLAAPFLGMPTPLNPAQILWINMLTHGLPGVAFGAEPMDPDVMRRPSPPPQQSVLGNGLLRQIVVAGLLITAVSLAAGLLAERAGEHVQTSVFLTLGLAQLGVGLALRAPRKGLDLRARGLEAACAGAAVLQLLGVVWSPLHELLGTQTLSGSHFVVLLALSVIPGLVTRVQHRLARHRRARPIGDLRP